MRLLGRGFQSTDCRTSDWAVDGSRNERATPRDLTRQGMISGSFIECFGRTPSDTDRNMRKSYKKPKNHQDFEELCLRVLRAYWKCPELDLYGVRGQAQHGVDIIDLSGQGPLRAAQCKLHEEGKVTTPDEVRGEIEKAKEFTPPLGLYIVMTTGKVRKEVHDLLIAINREHREQHLFIVKVFDWGRIEGLLDEYPDVRDWYEGGPPVATVGGIESTKFDQLLEEVKQLSAPDRGDDNQDRFHGEIDEARDYLEKHDYQITKLLLQRIKDRSWDQLNARHRFRVLTNLAAVEMAADNLKGAAELYLRAKTHQPDDETARTNEALGYLLLGQREQAFELVSKLREEFPRSERVLGIFIRGAPDSTSLESLEEAVPQDLLEKDEVAAALAQRALDSGETQKAEKFARAATVANSSAFGLWLLLGNIILQSEISRNYEQYGNEAVFRDTTRLSEAEEALGEALRLAKEECSTSGTVEALLNRRLTRIALQKDAEAREDLEEARQAAPQDSRVIEAYGVSFILEKRPEETINILRRLPLTHYRIMVKGYWAFCSWNVEISETTTMQETYSREW